jgi:hypothetical protein
MYLINKSSNDITKIEKCSFGELGFKEREHLQEWIVKEPSCLGEELLIIQKEFDGFSDTKERLDLLALDKQGALVIIENKLDDSGKDVTWQALKYASYCSSLSKEDIRQIFQTYLNKYDKDKVAEELLIEFYEGLDYDEIVLNKGLSQRVILIAANFRKEVTSTVMWLMNYNIRIQCFKVTPYKLGEQLLLDLEQIIPIKDAEDYVIKMAEKNQNDEMNEEKLKSRHYLRIEFWQKLLKQFKQQSNLFDNINPAKDNWIGVGNGISSGAYNFVIAKDYVRVEVYFSRSRKEENKYIFDLLMKNKEKIEESFGHSLVWQRLEDKKATRIKYQLDGVSLYNYNDWNNMINFLVSSMINIQSAFDDYIKHARLDLIKFMKKDSDEE